MCLCVCVCVCVCVRRRAKSAIGLPQSYYLFYVVVVLQLIMLRYFQSWTFSLPHSTAHYLKVKIQNRCITHVVFIYVTFSTFNVLNIFAEEAGSFINII